MLPLDFEFLIEMEMAQERKAWDDWRLAPIGLIELGWIKPPDELRTPSQIGADLSPRWQAVKNPRTPIIGDRLK